MLVPDRRAQVGMPNNRSTASDTSGDLEADCLYALITGQRSVSRRNRASWYLRQLNKLVKCDSLQVIEQDDHRTEKTPDDEGENDGGPLSQTAEHINTPEKDIFLVSMTANTSNSYNNNSTSDPLVSDCSQRFLVTPETRVLYLSKSIATSIILDLSPSILSVSANNDCVFLDSLFDALRRVLNLLVKDHEFPSSQIDRQYTLGPNVFVSVIAYTPFVVAKNNQVLIQNRRISSQNIEQLLVELWICMNRLIQELHELVTTTCGMSFEYDTKATNNPADFVGGGIMRHPGSVLEDIYDLGLFSSALMPRLSRLSVLVITDGLFASSNNLYAFRLRSIALSFISLASESVQPDGCFGYTTYTDLMRFVAKTTQGVYISHKELIDLTTSLPKTKQIPLLSNPLFRLFSWTLHSDISIGADDTHQTCSTPRAGQNFTRFSNSTSHSESVIHLKPENIIKLFCIDQPLEVFQSITQSSMERDQLLDPDLIPSQNYHDWRSFKQLSKSLDADFEQVLACFLREGYLIDSIHLNHRENSTIIAHLVLYWKHNVTLEQELEAPYWNSGNPFESSDSNNMILKPFLGPSYGDTHCKVHIHGSYNFLYDFYCGKKAKRRSEYRALSYRQFEALILGVKQTYEKLQYLSRFYRDPNLSKVPSFLLHGTSLFFENPHNNKLGATVDNVVDKTHLSREFSDYWQEVARLEQRNWTNLMHTHTLRLILEHDQPKHKNIHCQDAKGRFTHIQCRRAMSAISNFIKSYASFALLEDSVYVKLIHSKEDDLREIETSATKGFIVIKIKKLLPILVVYLMFTSGIQDSHRVQIVAYIEDQLVNCRMRNTRISTVSVSGGSMLSENILKSKIVYPTSDACCIQIRSPLERMLRIYSRSTLNEFLAQNLAHGLPGSCPYSSQQLQQQQQQRMSLLRIGKISSNGQSKSTSKASTLREQDQIPNESSPIESAVFPSTRYDPVFGKYLYGIRLVHTLNGLPNDLVQPIVANVLAKISAILVNVRIKQGFHIAYNKSGLLTLVSELAMKDISYECHSSNCLCQYLVFPPTITNAGPMHAMLLTNGSTLGTTPAIVGTPNGSTGDLGGNPSSKQGSLCGSLGNSDSSYMRRNHEATSNDMGTSSPTIQLENQGEIKVVREYWIEQQYGISSHCGSYHKSLENLRYSEVVDHLYQTDVTIFNCLLTYDILQLLCDKMSPFYQLDVALSQAESRSLSVLSPTTSTSSSMNSVDPSSPTLNYMPSNLIDGTTKDGVSRIPLIELDYEFSLVNFLDYCQFASLDVMLFLDSSEFYEQPSEMELEEQTQEGGNKEQTRLRHKSDRKLSMDTNKSIGSNQEPSRREHRSSYDSISAASFTYNYLNPIYSPSLNHLFLETLHKRLKQMHDKELRMAELDRRKLAQYLRRRKIALEFGKDATSELADDSDGDTELSEIRWRCFMRKGNQENLLIVFIPCTLTDISKWTRYVQRRSSLENPTDVCPVFVFRCSSTMINNQVLSFLHETSSPSPTRFEQDLSSDPGKLSLIEKDIVLHFGRPCRFLDKLRSSNDELENEVLPLNKFTEHAVNSDEKTLELVHFRAFLRKIKNTVLKSRFSSLNDAYLSELFVHKDDIQYYITNVDYDTQRKYHVSSHLKWLADFIRSYEHYRDSLPKETTRSSNPLLNSILLQKCGLYINQPIARFNEANPLMKQLHDRKLLFMMRCNYKVELPTLEEKLSSSTFLKRYIKWSASTVGGSSTIQQQSQSRHVPTMQSNSMLNANPANLGTTPTSGVLASSLGRSGAGTGARLMEMKCGSSVGAGGESGSIAGSLGTASLSGSPVANIQVVKSQQAPRFGISATSTAISSIAQTASPLTIVSPSNEIFFLEAFKNVACSIDEITPGYLDEPTLEDISLRHEAHMAEVLKRKGERKESLHYRRVLKSKANYNQSHSAIDQALKRVDSLGRLEHFCLTPLLFSPSWRSKLAPVRDHTIEPASTYHRKRTDDSIDVDKVRLTIQENQQGETSAQNTDQPDGARFSAPKQDDTCTTDESPAKTSPNLSQEDEEENERWHQMICYNYIKEYEQYIQTLGFNSIQVRQPSGSRLLTSVSTSSGFASHSGSPTSSSNMVVKLARKGSLQVNSNSIHQHQHHSRSTHKRAANGSSHRRESIVSPSNVSSSSVTSVAGGFVPQTTANSITTSSTNANTSMTTPSGTQNTGYLIKFLNSGCLVFKVGFCKPYVYSILYSIEGERFNNSNMKMNMTAFLDELDSIKVTLHLHSFTYDYHLRSMFSYISRRQMNFTPGYHLISFVDDFRKYYQKAPNYARNHILGGEVRVTGLKVNGQQLYNYIVTHNSVYQLDVLEMTNSRVSKLVNHFANGATNATSIAQQLSSLIKEQQQFKSEAGDDDQTDGARNHANDYVLIELKREKVRYKDGKDPDVFECGLLITHDHQQSNATKNCLVLKYFLLLTNQRDFYPKLVHAGDNIITLGCHRPIRLGLMSQQMQRTEQSSVEIKRSASTKSNNVLVASKADNSVAGSTREALLNAASNIEIIQPAPESTTTTTTNPTDLEDMLHSSEFLSSGELSGPQSIVSTVNSIHSSSSAGLQASLLHQQPVVSDGATATTATTDASISSSVLVSSRPILGIDDQGELAVAEEAADALVAEELALTEHSNGNSMTENVIEASSKSIDQAVGPSGDSSSSLTLLVNQIEPAGGQAKSSPRAQDRTICDEEITYLGYFSSDEMDMLRFLQEKTANLRQHLEKIVRSAEVHYRRDYLWHKLMQRPVTNSDPLHQMTKSLTALSTSSSVDNQQLPLTIDELAQLLQTVEAIDLASLDPNLSTFTTMHINWYLKLVKAFNELGHSSSQHQQHRIYTVKASKILLLYIDPKCSSAFILLSINCERSSVEMSMVLKDKQEFNKSSNAAGQQAETAGLLELDTECQQLISDFINFCATFMWSDLLVT